ncbi:anaerobic ribonucleoside-triphosphate reductase, partial [Erysipelothrix rhusiopathiae]|nr:anaerobic ribonucleoside-triphosphate reductase [Erysipelothrix rhusiopathiae]
ALAAIAIQSNQNDQHGGQSIPAFDYYMAPGVLATFKKQFKQNLHDFREPTELDKDERKEGLAKNVHNISASLHLGGFEEDPS